MLGVYRGTYIGVLLYLCMYTYRGICSMVCIRVYMYVCIVCLMYAQPSGGGTRVQDSFFIYVYVHTKRREKSARYAALSDFLYIFAHTCDDAPRARSKNARKTGSQGTRLNITYFQTRKKYTRMTPKSGISTLFPSIFVLARRNIRKYPLRGVKTALEAQIRPKTRLYPYTPFWALLRAYMTSVTI